MLIEIEHIQQTIHTENVGDSKYLYNNIEKTSQVTSNHMHERFQGAQILQSSIGSVKRIVLYSLKC